MENRCLDVTHTPARCARAGLANGFFVAAEFAIISVRKTRID